MRTTTSSVHNDLANSAKAFISINPTNGNVIQEFQAFTKTQIEECLQDSRMAFAFWKNQKLSFRKDCILQLAQKLQDNKEIFAELITAEMGKPITQSIAEISKCIWLCEYYAQNASKLLKAKTIKTEAQKSYVRYEPIGAILGVMPWNFPFWQVLRFAIPALMAGNVVLLKPAPNVALSGLAIAKIFKEVLPDFTIFQSLLAAVEDIPFIIQQDLVQGISFTGSDAVGAKIASLAGKEIKKSVLELGGSDAFIVLEDADLVLAAKLGAKSRMNNCGQTCISAKRFIVAEKVATEFLELLKSEILSLKIGDPMDSDTEVSTLARADLSLNLERQLNDAIEKGAQPYLPGGPRKGKAHYFDPVILTQVRKNMRAYQEELFGPIAVVYTVKNEAEAIALANDTKYGLGAALWTRDLAKAEQLASQLKVGAIAINNLLSSDPRLPFGGVKRSGYGRELALEGIMEFVNIKSVSVF